MPRALNPIWRKAKNEGSRFGCVEVQTIGIQSLRPTFRVCLFMGSEDL